MIDFTMGMDRIDVVTATVGELRYFLDRWHPLGAGGSLRGLKIGFLGIEGSAVSFVAVYTAPRSRWTRVDVVLELSRLAWSPGARHSASTFLVKTLRLLRRAGYRGKVVTYAMPGTSGVVYLRAGFRRFGFSSGARRSRRGPNGRPTPDTVGSGIKLMRFIYEL